MRCPGRCGGKAKALLYKQKARKKCKPLIHRGKDVTWYLNWTTPCSCLAKKPEVSQAIYNDKPQDTYNTNESMQCLAFDQLLPSWNTFEATFPSYQLPDNIFNSP